VTIPLCPPTIVFGSKTPDLRISMKGGVQKVFCNNNPTLHLTEASLNENGTYEMGVVLGRLCREKCRPGRSATQPCPAFASSHMVGTENKGLATVEMRAFPEWEECPGVRALLDLTDTTEERYLLLSYIRDRFGDERTWRDELVTDWNKHWYHVEEKWGDWSRRSVFDSMLWATLRYPALIPQAWLNYLYAASEDEIKILDEYPSRVDFIAFHGGQRHVIEIDGPSHYASYDEATHEYTVDERAYARNLKIARSLLRDTWVLTRIARIEVRDVMQADWPEMEGLYDLMKLLPGTRKGYPNPSLPETLREALRDVEMASVAHEDIPF
jgi:hypothetical protein